jgi:hypothetical protein
MIFYCSFFILTLSQLGALCSFDSEVISGLVFKKGASHKQMRANIKHPKLLLLQGALGYSSTGLSSINSMKQVRMLALSPSLFKLHRYNSK